MEIYKQLQVASCTNPVTWNKQQIYFLILQSVIMRNYKRKLIKIPAATAEPITPATFGAIACIKRWLLGSAFNPMF